MGSLLSSTAVLLSAFLLSLLFGFSSVLCQDLRERDAICNEDGCFVVYFQRKTFLDSWKSCKEKGGNLATIKRKEDASVIASLFSTIDLRNSRTKVRVWIGLQRQPRQCTTTWPLRGFSWTTGDQDTEYTNWQKEDSLLCSAPRCVVMGYGNQEEEQSDNFKWLDGSCSVTVDGYLCHYAYKGMCAALWNIGAGNALYITPFNLLSTLLTHVPLGSVANMPCPSDTKEEQSALCMLKEDGSVGWSYVSSSCLDPPASHNWCDQDNGGCEHFCRLTGVHFYCECAEGYHLGENGQNCELSNVCQGTSCEFECVPLSDGYRCVCPEGYMLATDRHGCLDVDECLQNPCEQLCVNVPGTFECQCREGYQPDDAVCEDIDECINDPCEHACENTPGSHICHCHLGYSPMPEDTSRCQDTDECRIHGTCAHDPPTQEPERDAVYIENGETNLLEWGQTSQPELEVLTNIINTTPQPTTKSLSTPHWYEGNERETTTAFPFISNSTQSEGVWNWLVEPTTSSQKEGNSEDSPIDHNMVTVSSNHSQGKEKQNQFSENFQFPVEDLMEKDYFENTHSPDSALPTQITPSQRPLKESGLSGDNLDSIQADRERRHSNNWLLVGLLVAICICIVVMVAVGIVYCNHCAVQTRNKNANDCYHWISGALTKLLKSGFDCSVEL
uniref:Uncharacterized protein n=1 Tax=Mola mola TaxID=94237 RepID=A0A3Q4BXX1_MOLML